MRRMILPLTRYAQFTGRSGRREFWLYSLFLVLGYIGIFAVGVALQIADEQSTLVGPVVAVGWALFFLANFVPGLALSVRRLHDVGLSGAVLIALFVAMLLLNVLGWIAYLVVMSLPPNAGPNRHGPPVGEKNVAEVFA